MISAFLKKSMRRIAMKHRQQELVCKFMTEFTAVEHNAVIIGYTMLSILKSFWCVANIIQYEKEKLEFQHAFDFIEVPSLNAD